MDDDLKGPEPGDRLIISSNWEDEKPQLEEAVPVAPPPQKEKPKTKEKKKRNALWGFWGFWLKLFLFFGFWGTIAAIGGMAYLYHEYGRDLPSHEHMVNYAPPIATRLHAADGGLIAEYATEKRLFMPIEAIPQRVINPFLAAEDKGFYSHIGIDFISLAGAVVNNVERFISGRRLVGASTITQQVAKNFLAGNERRLERKIREAFIALRLEQDLSKGQILELYLNEIWFGLRSYGIAAAALNYFDKSLEELTLEEAAYLAALPKGASQYHPFKHEKRAIGRRNWVLNQMAENGFVTKEEAEAAKAMPLGVKQKRRTEIQAAPYFAEEVRKELVEHYGIKTVNEGGLSARTSVDLRLQKIADNALKDGLVAYDRRHGWRGPLARIETEGDAALVELMAMERPAALRDKWEVAFVVEVGSKSAELFLQSGDTGLLLLENVAWARAWKPGQKRGGKITKVTDVLRNGDVIAVSLIDADSKTFELQQVPDINGALLAMDPHTGRVLAQSGGWDFEQSEFNRATQAARQPGSTIKPFVYLAALDQGYSPATTVLDSPVVIDQLQDEAWRPENSDGKFLGPQPLRVGLERSRNLMTIRIADAVGMEKVSEYVKRFGIDENMPPYLSMSLGAGETTLIKMVRAYAMLVNGGKRIEPTMIDRVQDRRGKTLFKHDARYCHECESTEWNNLAMPALLDEREQIADPISAYQVVSMLRGVVQRGTARSLRDTVNRPIGGKTGTTNKAQDAWFVGFTPDLVVGVYVGFDKPKPLGKGEYGGRAAGPIFRDFVNNALEGTPAQAFRVPKGVVFRNIDPVTGVLIERGDEEAGSIGYSEGFRAQATGTDGQNPALNSSNQPTTVDSFGYKKTNSEPTSLGGIY
ncbi:penicillin-binding protein 1A [Alphaproteobacteria bacterium]|nr:penicillin-binding protein 1A [Alphaproteobacteria bacterium]